MNYFLDIFYKFLDILDSLLFELSDVGLIKRVLISCVILGILVNILGFK